MARIPTPLPQSVVGWVSSVFGGGLLDVLWWLFVTSLLVFIAYLLVAGLGVIGGIIAGALVTTLVNDEIRAFVGDVYRRDFWVWRA